ncbi:ethanolamine utilization protein EutJ [Clostridia bacterium]|nr:ethanolamine utilization protein EutJ [Clostridia bacterium]
MKIKKRLFVVLVVLIPFLAGCGGGGGGNSADAIKVGVNYELTGAVASYGSDSVKGIQMAIDEINAAGGVNGKNIDLVIVDDKSDSAESASVAAKLMEQENVVACLGPATTGNFKATIPGAMSNKVSVISASATGNDGVTTDASGNVNDYVFRICFTDSFQGVTMANFSAGKLAAQKAAIYKDTSSDYAKGLAESFRATFEQLGGTIVAEEGYVKDDTDFRAVLTGLKNNDFDVLFVPGYYQEAGLIISQARELGINVPILGADGFDSPILLELAGAAALSDVYFSNHYSSLDEDPVVKDFIQKYADANNGESPGAFHALGYDLGKYIVDAIQRAGGADREAIKNALASTENFVGVTGSFSMGPDHNPIKSVVVIEMQNGEQVSAEKVAVQS